MKAFNEMQLRFELDLDEAAGDAEERAISQEEARLISAAARRTWERGGKGVGDPAEAWNPETPWVGDYTRLIEQGWPWRVACYIAWAASPKIDRWPETLEKLAKDVLGLNSPRVIYTWRRKYPSIDTVVAMMQAAPLWEHRRDVIEALVAMASTADYKAFNDRKLFLEMTGDYTPKNKLELGKAAKGDGEELSDAELRALLGEDDLTTNGTNSTNGEEEGEA